MSRSCGRGVRLRRLPPPVWCLARANTIDKNWRQEIRTLRAAKGRTYNPTRQAFPTMGK